METQFKEEINEDSLCFESSSEDVGSLSIIEKYDLFLQRENSDADSDADDFFPDDSMIRREYAQLRSDTANYRRTSNHRLSTGLPAKYKNIPETTLSVTDDDPANGSADVSEEAGDSTKTETSLIELEKLLKILQEVRNCHPEDGNSIFCTESELEAIQERYAAILDYLHNLQPTFEKTSNCKDLDSQNADDDDEEESRNGTEENNFAPSQSEDMQMLAKKMESVRRTRDRFYEVEQQVREQIEQLELVERYKMESVS